MLFKSYPKVSRVIEDNIVEVQDILRKVVFTDESIEKDKQFVTYKKRDGDTLESIARKFYGRDELSWVIMLFNKVIDPFYGVSLSTASHDKYMQKKIPRTDSVFVCCRLILSVIIKQCWHHHRKSSNNKDNKF